MKNAKYVIVAAVFPAMLLVSCSATQTPCEDILEVKRQEQICSELSKIMNKSTNPQQALTARKRFETECENLRYYRDDYDTICKGKQAPIGGQKEPTKD